MVLLRWVQGGGFRGELRVSATLSRFGAELRFEGSGFSESRVSGFGFTLQVLGFGVEGILYTRAFAVYKTAQPLSLYLKP